jgi:hypothetical protein
MELIKEAKRLQKLAGILREQDEDQQQPAEETPSAENPEQPSGPITKAEAKQLIKDTKGKFFTVTFIKKDGTTRVMNARLGVKAYLKGGELPYDPEAKGLIPVFDIPKREYRMVNVNTINKLKIGNNEYEVR